MWFISPPVPQHKEWGLSLTLGMALSQPTTAAQVGMRSTLCLGNEQAGALEALFKFCWVSCAYITILHLAQGKPRGTCPAHLQLLGRVRAEHRWMGKGWKPSGTLQAEERLLSLCSRRARCQRCPAGTRAGSGDIQGSGLCLAGCGEQLVHSKGT